MKTLTIEVPDIVAEATKELFNRINKIDTDTKELLLLFDDFSKDVDYLETKIKAAATTPEEFQEWLEEVWAETDLIIAND